MVKTASFGFSAICWLSMITASRSAEVSTDVSAAAATSLAGASAPLSAGEVA